MTVKLGVVMDPIETIHPLKDSTLAMLLEAQRRGWELVCITQQDLFLRDGVVFANMRTLQVRDTAHDWYSLAEQTTQALHQLDILLMRKDPPFDLEYIYTTYLLELAEQKGLFVVNKPQSLRDANEKVFACWFSQCMPATLVSRNQLLLKKFIAERQDVVVKPLNDMGGGSIFRLTQTDQNVNVVLETLTQKGQQTIMAQQFIPDIAKGDKRVLMINGEPVPYALARIPQAGDIRGNIAAGGKGVGVELTEQDRWICQQVGPILRKKGLFFVGLDIIGEYLTEINVTSPTCIREIDAAYNINIAAMLLDSLQVVFSNAKSD